VPTVYPNTLIENTLKKTNVKFWKAKALKFDTKCNGYKKTSAKDALERIERALVDIKSSGIGGSYIVCGIIRFITIFSLAVCGPALAGG